MTFSSVPSVTSADLTLAELRQILRADMVACRQSTLMLLENLTDGELRHQAHPDFSPMGWHLGHIAFTESLWLLENLKQDPCPYPQYRRLFAADGLPKAEREHLPPLPDLLAFLQDIRDRTLTYLETAPLYDQLRLWRWILQHESQHAETATYVLAMHQWAPPAIATGTPLRPAGQDADPAATTMVLIPGGTFAMGSDSVDALDNERPQHAVTVDDYWLDRTPVTVDAYRVFIAAGGYQQSQWWEPQGWDWVQRHGIRQPRYWSAATHWGTRPVCGVSWYEADAYARFRGKRLPTEVEWERAARWQSQPDAMPPYPWGTAPLTLKRANFGGLRGQVTPVVDQVQGISATDCLDLLGNVWEWTDTWFDGYPGFTPYPYGGYSQTYFDQAHRVLRGGSWATRPWVLRPTFRNWYHPWMQQPFAGFRCALTP